MKRTAQILAAVTILAFLLFHSTTLTNACGPYFPSVVFVRTIGPDAPLSHFAQGQLGVIQPTWFRAYLSVSYRYLSGKPLSAVEQRSFAESWTLTGRADGDSEAYQHWVDTRAKFANTPAPTANRTSDRSYVENGYDVCPPPAFQNAALTLQNRAKAFGPKSADLQEWIAGQDGVFMNCSPGVVKAIPATLPASPNKLLSADRAYQIAAANFYAENFDVAEKAFDSIAKELDSPWRTIAPYLAARTVIRRGTLVTKPDQPFDSDTLKLAAARLQAIIADPNSKNLHNDAFRLLSFINLRVEPEAWRRKLAARLASGASGENFGQDLVDYCLLLDKKLDEDPDFEGVNRWSDEYDRKAEQWRQARYTKLADERADDLGDWLITVQSRSTEATKHAVARWRATKSNAWLAAAIMNVESNDPSATELLTAAADVAPSSPAYLTLAYHRARLYIARKDMPSARKVLQNVKTQVLPPSATNLFKDQQLLTAEREAEFVSFLARVPSGYNPGYETTAVETSCSGQECSPAMFDLSAKSKQPAILPQFDPLAAKLLNTQLPMSILTRIADSQSIPESLRKRMTPAMWARAALLGDVESARTIAPSAVKSEPALEPYIRIFDQAKDRDERRFAAVFAIMHFPGMRPFVDDGTPRLTPISKVDEYRDNWWCSDVGSEPEIPNFSKEYNYSPRKSVPAAPAFLSIQERDSAAREWAMLKDTGYASVFLPKVAIAFAKARPDDPRVPEALHYAVRVTRFSCDYASNDGKQRGPNYSREAFTILHQRYGKSEWAKKTPHYY